MPMGMIFLVRSDCSYCAVRFTKEEMGKIDGEYFAAYESWYQGDGTGDFSKLNVIFVKDDLWWKLPIGIGRLWLFSRKQDEVRCGDITLRWLIRTSVELIPTKTTSKLESIRFAPTPWTSISQVNVADKRLTWYEARGVEDDRRDIRIPIEFWKVDINKEKELQELVDKGHQSWRRDPVSVAHAAVVAVDKTVKIEDCEVRSYTGDIKANVLCKGVKEYSVELRRFIRPTEDGIWTAVSVEVNKK